MVSGSENPGHAFFWEKETEAIVQMVIGDIGGVVNCLEPHPYVPILATSGLSDQIRLWHPSKDEVCVNCNVLQQINGQPSIYRIRN